MDFSFISFKFIAVISRTINIKGIMSTKKIVPMPVNDASVSPKTDVGADMDDSVSSRHILRTVNNQSIHSTCKPRRTRRVVFNEKPEIQYYDPFIEFIDHSKLYYTSNDYRRFEIEADMEETRCKLDEVIQSIQKKTEEEWGC
jgi:hypothetical protein